MNDQALDPFSVGIMNRIFKLDRGKPVRLITRENSWLEFKESFNWGSRAKYARTMAAFVNTQGGYIVFGIKRRPHEILGLSTMNFENLDIEKVTEFLNKAFSPEIHWDIAIHEVEKKKVGIIYVAEARSKPVVCTTDQGEDLRNGDIYYRYRGRTERIRHPELRDILEQERRRERELWLKNLRHMAKIGVDNVGLLDMLDGQVTIPGARFLISEDLLKKMTFVREGSFTESMDEGKPTLRLLGDVEVMDSKLIQPVKKVHVPKALNAPEIILGFLNQEEIVSPLDYIKQICFESSGYLPVYWYIKQAGLSLSEVVSELEKCLSRQRSKDTLIGRLSGEDILSIGSMTAATKSGEKRRQFSELIGQKSLPNQISEKELKYLFEAITHLERENIDLDYILPYVLNMFQATYENIDGNTASAMRKAICHLDKLLYREDKNKGRKVAPKHQETVS
jgi:hypothetical protein